MSLREWVAQERARERARSSDLRLRETFPQTGPDGWAFPASPIVRSRRANVPPVNVVRNPPVGRTIAVVRGSQVLDGGGNPVEWEGRHPTLVGAGFTETEFPTSQLEIAQDGYWIMPVSFRWESWTGGGQVWVSVNGVRRTSIERSLWGVGFDKVFDLGVLVAGDVVELVGSPVGGPNMQPDGQVAVDLEASLMLVEPPVQIAQDSVTLEPLSGYTVWNQASAMAPNGVTVTVTANTNNVEGLQVGDLLLVMCNGTSTSAGSGVHSFTPPVGVTELWLSDYIYAGSSNWAAMFGVYWKWADAADVAGQGYSASQSVSSSTFSGASETIRVSLFAIRASGLQADPFISVAGDASLSGTPQVDILSLPAPSAGTLTLAIASTLKNAVVLGSDANYLLDFNEPPYETIYNNIPGSIEGGPPINSPDSFGSVDAGLNAIAVADGRAPVECNFGESGTTAWLVRTGLQ